MSCGWVLGILLTCVSLGFARDKVIAPDLSRINDGKMWNLINAISEAAIEGGKSVVRLDPRAKTTTPSNIGLALVEGIEFDQGVLEIDLKGRGEIQRCFLGVAFNVAEGSTFEAVYFRPFNFTRAGSFRERAIQYVAWPEHTWETLRQEKPGKYESAVKPVPDPAGWFHARIEVGKNKVKVFVNSAKEPCLVVDRLAHPKKGKVGLWVDSRGGTFGNLKIVVTE
jgi:hypothetical protein